MNPIHADDNKDGRILLALAGRDPGFDAFCREYQPALPEDAALPAGFSGVALEAVKADPAMAGAAEACRANPSQAYALPGLTEFGVLLAALYLLRTHIRLERGPDGRWSFLLEHEAENLALDKLAGMLKKLLHRAG